MPWPYISAEGAAGLSYTPPPPKTDNRFKPGDRAFDKLLKRNVTVESEARGNPAMYAITYSEKGVTGHGWRVAWNLDGPRVDLRKPDDE